MTESEWYESDEHFESEMSYEEYKSKEPMFHGHFSQTTPKSQKEIINCHNKKERKFRKKMRRVMGV